MDCCRVYPRVKVREQEEPVDGKEETTKFILRVLDSLSLENHHSSRICTSNQGNETEMYSPPSCARISKFSHQNFLTPPISASKVKKEKELSDNKTNIRASSVPRPRAVLSSPDNDVMIGSQNRKLRDSHGQEKGSITSQNLHAPIKPSHGNVRAKNPINSKKVSKESGNNSYLKQKQASQPAASMPRASIRN